MSQEQRSLTDFKRYVRLGVKDGRPNVFIEQLLFYPDVRRMAFNYMSSDWVENGEPVFDVVVALPNKGHKLADIADFSGSGIKRIFVEKGTKLDSAYYETISYEQFSQQNGGKTASGKASKKYLQVERELVSLLIEGHEPVASRERAKVYAEAPFKNNRLDLNDEHVKRIEAANRPKALLVDGFIEDGGKSLAAAEMLSKLGVDTVGLACIVELVDWKGETYNGRAALKKRGIAFKSLIVYEHGEFRNVAANREPDFTVPEARDAQNSV